LSTKNIKEKYYYNNILDVIKCYNVLFLKSIFLKIKISKYALDKFRWKEYWEDNFCKKYGYNPVGMIDHNTHYWILELIFTY